MNNDQIKLGQKVRDIITGAEGIATAKVEYINGCVQYAVTPQASGAGIPEAAYLDHQRLEVVGAGIEVRSSNTGGPDTRIRSNTPRY